MLPIRRSVKILAGGVLLLVCSFCVLWTFLRLRDAASLTYGRDPVDPTETVGGESLNKRKSSLRRSMVQWPSPSDAAATTSNVVGAVPSSQVPRGNASEPQITSASTSTRRIPVPSEASSNTSLPSKNSPTEAQIKAAFVFNFLRFSTFPDSAFPDASSPFRIASDDQEILDFLEHMAQRKINNRSYVLEFVQSGQMFEQQPHLFYTSGSNWASVSQRFKNPELVLTVSDSPNFLENGGMIQLVKNGDRFSFRVNGEAIAKSRIVVSGKILRLAQSPLTEAIASNRN
jgi:hypothetical protein